MPNEITLYPYQQDGRDFLAARRYAFLADTMGLGKSGQAIAAADTVGACRILVIAPASVRFNWDREFDRFSRAELPSKIILKGTDEPLPVGVTICSYELAVQDAMRARLSAIAWDLVIFDEAHFLKETAAQRTKALLGQGGIIHKSKRVWLLSGTPAPNHPGEMWTWLYTLFPHAIDRMPYEKFLDTYCRTRETEYGLRVVGGKNLEELKKRLEPIMLRRRKEDVLKDLPPITYADLVLDPATCDPEALHKAMEAEKSPDGERLRAVLEGDMEALEGLEIATLRRLTGLAKVHAVANQITYDLTAGGMDKVVVFGIHRDVVRNLRNKLRKFQAHLVFGGMTAEKKQNKIDSFQINHKARVFIANMAAAGTGIDGLQHACCNVLFIESSWTPADNMQAVMRLHRIGQERPVTARFVSLADSLDEHVQRVIRRKTQDLQILFD
jgi:SWI/SNF-related matrix-associated actin-dependent regulator of chromatin subfamily A-like protein 1